MKLNLSLDPKGDLQSVLDIAYPFVPACQFKVEHGLMQTVIDAAHDPTPDQWSVMAKFPCTITLVFPDGVTPPPDQPPTTTPDQPVSSTS